MCCSSLSEFLVPFALQMQSGLLLVQVIRAVNVGTVRHCCPLAPPSLHSDIVLSLSVAVP